MTAPAAGVVAGTTYSLAAGTYGAANSYAVVAGYLAQDHHILVVAPAQATVSVADEITLPPDAEVDRAVFAVTARPAGRTAVSSVADVRDGTAVSPSSVAKAAAVIDFGRLVAVAGVDSPFAQTTTARWTGSAFSLVSGGTSTVFPEQVTDKLLAQFTTQVSASAFRAQGTVDLPAVPSGLELLVDGVTAWLQRQGSGAGLDVPAAGNGVAYAADLTDAVRAAFDRRPGGPVRVELRTLTPGLLSLAPSVAHHRVHQVAFPDGAAKALDLPAEGPFTLELPLPAESGAWEVQQVRALVRGGAPDDRVQPADGPPLALGDAELTLAPGRVLLAQVPPALSARYAFLSAVRLPLLAPGSGGEVSARLLSDAGGRPGDPVDGGAFTAVRVDATAPTWTTLTLPGLLPLGSAALWLEIQATYGTVGWALTANPATDPVAPGAVLHRRLPGGGVRAFPQLVEVGALHGALRLVGRPDVHRPIALVSLDLGTGSPVEATPGGGDVAVTIGVPQPVTPVAGRIVADGVATATAQLVFTDVRVRYRDSS